MKHRALWKGVAGRFDAISTVKASLHDGFSAAPKWSAKLSTFPLSIEPEWQRLGYCSYTVESLSGLTKVHGL